MKDKIVEAVCRRLLRESIDMGAVEFSQFRSDGAPNDEPDTEEESELLAALDRWIVQNSMGRETADALRDLMDGSRYHKFFSRPPADSTLYRGAAMTPQQIADLFGVDPSTVGRKGTFKGQAVVPLSAGKPAASWSKSRSQAGTFAAKHFRPGENLMVMLMAAAGDNPRAFLDLEAVLSRMQGHPTSRRYVSEKECVALDAVVVKGAVWSDLTVSF